MAETPFRFEDGAAYERMMGTWSRLVGDVFLDWLAPSPGLRWLDVGCGNGAFTELVVERCDPAAVHGIDPSEGQLAFARGRRATRVAQFRQGDAMAVPFAERTFDVATMALVIFFLPDPAKGVAEMARVVRAGGTVASYAWDILGGGFPLEPFRVELRAMGVTQPMPPTSDASRMQRLQELWMEAGLEAVETREITVRRTFADFEEFWSIAQGSSVGQTVAAMTATDVATLKARLRACMPVDAAGRITYEARANAIKGRVPE
jgi:ubiquinone/menaquinone biosynthesis C-methylase UbiE